MNTFPQPVSFGKELGRFSIFAAGIDGAVAGASPGQFPAIRTAEGNDPLFAGPSASMTPAPIGWRSSFGSPDAGMALLADKKEGETVDRLGPLGRRLPAGWRLARARNRLARGRRPGHRPLYLLGRRLVARGAVGPGLLRREDRRRRSRSRDKFESDRAAPRLLDGRRLALGFGGFVTDAPETGAQTGTAGTGCSSAGPTR
ncbi:MAG: hypothetical protein MZU79_01315 [Anaerotruncus sp.]|nr:hypothetical protein [Anaerotruncus sp.]